MPFNNIRVLGWSQDEEIALRFIKKGRVAATSLSDIVWGFRVAAAALRRRRIPAAPLALVRSQNRPGAGRSALPKDAVAIVRYRQRNRALVTSVWPGNGPPAAE
jgi:hypothetical protein